MNLSECIKFTKFLDSVYDRMFEEFCDNTEYLNIVLCIFHKHLNGYVDELNKKLKNRELFVYGLGYCAICVVYRSIHGELKCTVIFENEYHNVYMKYSKLV